MADFKLELSGIDRLAEAMNHYAGNAEKSINDVLHNEAGDIIQNSIRLLIPESGAKWKGKAPPAKGGNSLRNMVGNLFVDVTTTKRYQYLYFPDDGSSTTSHAGNQQFFYRGGEAVKDEVIDRCIERLVNDFERS